MKRRPAPAEAALDIVKRVPKKLWECWLAVDRRDAKLLALPNDKLAAMAKNMEQLLLEELPEETKASLRQAREQLIECGPITHEDWPDKAMPVWKTLQQANKKPGRKPAYSPVSLVQMWHLVRGGRTKRKHERLSTTSTIPLCTRRDWVDHRTA